MLAAGALVAALAGCTGTGGRSLLALPRAALPAKSSFPAAAGDLIYVVDNGLESVYQYSYETRKRLNTIQGPFYDVVTMCADTKQDIFVVDDAAQSIREYSHDGKTVIKTLVDFFGFPEACSVDPTTGNLAVTNFENASGEFPGNLVIFSHTGHANSHHVFNMYNFYFPAYDDKGNLFVNGNSTRGSPVLSERRKGGGGFEDLTMSPKIASMFGMQWDGKYLAICDTGHQPNEIDRFSISRSGATKVSSTILQDDADVYQFFIAAIGAKDVIIATDRADRKLYAWRYPLGGNPIFSIGGFMRPLGVAISRTMP